MKVSAGIIITDGKKILLGHSTGNSHWDIPKGEVDLGEEYIDTAIRETKEEFGITFKKEELIDLGLFSYLKRKNLYLFKITVKGFPTECECTSFFKGKNGMDIPEIDDFKVFSNKEGLSKLNKSMQKVFIEHNLI